LKLDNTLPSVSAAFTINLENVYMDSDKFSTNLFIALLSFIMASMSFMARPSFAVFLACEAWVSAYRTFVFGSS